MNRPGDLLLNPWALVSVAVILINDHVLKGAFGNTMTGKLSDVAGVFLLPLLLLSVLEVLRRSLVGRAAIAWSIAVTGIGFADASAWLDEVLLAEALSSSLSSSLSLLSASASSLRSLVSLLSDADELSESAELDESEPDMMCEQAVRVGVATRARPASRVAAVRTDFMMLRGLRDKDLGRTSWSAGNALWRQLPNGGGRCGGLASRGCQRTVVRMVDTMVSTSSALPAVTAMRT